MTKELVFSTSKKRQLINITNEAQKAVGESGVEEGVCLVFAPHATAAILLNEDEAGFKEDVETLLQNWIPEGNWQHNQIDDNATAHLASAFIGQSKTIPIVDGKLKLGTWQELFLLELDGPRQNRKIVVTFLAA
ncbi:MAG: hypothetical protein A2126_04500 [Candidatus Woykebacteria bacterium GWB1_45_5]|uniref:Secondary thiamine-phosphate synthase enzyme n=2 Tax=Candidatus Woykeibacteriota TaxID=1817899 RepID=A0A1G1W063_9BACT|nr:MAG: hypothetical protein A2113_02895 [Candidatus Woykebacteria bacterium GWA1_44_8]OGY22730.1 MAG: hypothetical protein A2126_04500 [Candidatus Woykebacteria bacterium GWB1_45_5]